MGPFYLQGNGQYLSSYWTDDFPTGRVMLPPACHSENFLNIVSLRGFNSHNIRITIPNLIIIFRGEV